MIPHRFALLGVGALLALATSVHAQQFDEPLRLPVTLSSTIWVGGIDPNATEDEYVDFEFTFAGESSGTKQVWSNDLEDGPTITVNLQVNQVVTLDFETSSPVWFEPETVLVTLNLFPPRGYRLRVVGGPAYYLDKSLRYYQTTPAEHEPIQVVLEPIDGDPVAPGVVSISGLGKLLWGVSLGPRTGGFSAGYVSMAEPELPGSGVTPEHLRVVDDGVFLEVIRGTQSPPWLEQVRFPTGLLVVTPFDSGGVTGFDFGWYHPNQVGSKSGDHYTLIMNAEPFRRHTVRDEEVGDDRIVTIAQYEGAATSPGRVWAISRREIEEDKVISVTSLGSGFSSMDDLRTRSEPFESGSGETAPQFGGDFVHLDEVRDGSVLIARRWKEFLNFADGVELIADIGDPDLSDVEDAERVATLYTYYSSPALYRLPKTIRYPDGRWVAFLYHDAGLLAGQIKAIAEPWLDGPAEPPSSFTTSWDQGKLTLFEYAADGIPLNWPPLWPDAWPALSEVDFEENPLPADPRDPTDPLLYQRGPRVTATTIKVLGSTILETQSTYHRDVLEGRPVVITRTQSRPETSETYDWTNLADSVVVQIDEHAPLSQSEGLGGTVVMTQEAAGRMVTAMVAVGTWAEDGNERSLTPPEDLEDLANEPDTVTVSIVGQRAATGWSWSFGSFQEGLATYTPDSTLTFKDGSTTLVEVIPSTTVWLLANRSTATFEVRTAKGVILSESYVYSGSGTFQRIGWERTDWHADGFGPTARTNHLGLEQEWQYVETDGTIDKETRADGTVVTHFHDSRGRVTDIEESSSGHGPVSEFDNGDGEAWEFAAVPDRILRYEYDAANRVTAVRLGKDSEENLVASHTYDRAGRLRLTTEPCGRTTEIEFSGTLSGAPTGHTWYHVRTATEIGGAGLVVTETRFRDGRVKQIDGTGAQPQRFAWTVVDAGSGWGNLEQNIYLREAKDTSPGEVLAETRRFDGHGALTMNWKPSAHPDDGWIWVYNQFNQRHVPSRTYVYAPGFPNSGHVRHHLYFHDALGLQSLAALDVNDNNAPDLSGPDQILVRDTKFVYRDSAWWLRNQSYTYPDASSSTTFVTGRTETQLTGLGAGQVGEVHVFQPMQISPSSTIGTLVGRQRSYLDSDTGLAWTESWSNQATSGSVQAGRRGLAEYVRTPTGAVTRNFHDELGRLVATRHWSLPDAEEATAAETSYSYMSGSTRLNEQRRLVGMTEEGPPPVEAVTTYGYADCSRLSTITTVAPGATGTVTKTVRLGYDSRGRQTHVWGSGAQPLWRRYDTWGHLAEQRTFREEPTGGWDAATWPYTPIDGMITAGQATSWEREVRTGMVKKEVDHANHYTEIEYDGINREVKRTLARDEISLDYGNTPGRFRRMEYRPFSGELTAIRYIIPDGENENPDPDTADVVFTLDRMGRIMEVEDGLGARTFVYASGSNSRRDLIREELPSGYYLGRHIGHTYNSDGRWDGYQIGTSGAPALEGSVAYSWSAASGRLSSLETALDPAALDDAVSRTWTYAYAAGGSLPTSVSTPLSAGNFIRSTGYDPYRPGTVVSANNSYNGTHHATYGYTWDGHGRLTEAQQWGTMFTSLYGHTGLTVNHTYDSLDRLTETKSEWLDNEDVKELPDRGMKVVYDSAGNRTKVERYRQVAGTPSADIEKYTVNDLNQVEKFEPVDSSGESLDTRRALFTGRGALAEESTLKLVSESTTTHVNRAHDYFYDSRVKTMTSDGWVYGELLLDDVHEAEAYIPLRAAEEERAFDPDGNPETSGSTTFVYDAENRLIRLSTGQFEAEFAYDYLGRRARSEVRKLPSGSWQTFDHLYVGGLLAGLLHSNGEEYERHLFTWGLDRSGTMGGAGGIGGLLEVTVGGEFGEVPVRADYLAATDGLGNVVAYLNRADGERKAEFEYSPFGETVRASGDLAQFGDFIFPLRHQTKFSSAFYLGFELPVHELYDYGQRSYEPTLGRFLNRDPIGLAGGANVYAYLGGTAFSAWDAWGWLAIGNPDPSVKPVNEKPIDLPEHLVRPERDPFALIKALSGGHPTHGLRGIANAWYSYSQILQHTWALHAVSNAGNPAPNGDTKAPDPVVEHPRCGGLRRALEDAKLARASYPGEPDPDGWERIAHQRFGVGLDISVFAGRDGRIVVGVAGTDELRDFGFQNIPEAVLALGEHTKIAVDFTESLIERGVAITGSTGHSLAGGVASVLGARFGLQTNTFNAAGVHPLTMRDYRLSRNDFRTNVRAHFVRGDPLTRAQDSLFLLPSAAGRRYAYSPLCSKYCNQPSAYDRQLYLHSIGGMIDALEKEMKELGCKNE